MIIQKPQGRIRIHEFYNKRGTKSKHKLLELTMALLDETQTGLKHSIDSFRKLQTCKHEIHKRTSQQLIIYKQREEELEKNELELTKRKLSFLKQLPQYQRLHND